MRRLPASLLITAFAFLLTGCNSVPSEGSTLLIMFGIAIGTFGSEDLACITAGILAAQGQLSYPEAVFASLMGIFVGDLLLYALGASAGTALAKRPPLSWWINQDALERGKAVLGDHLGKVVVSSRFLPGSRLPTYLAAGALRIPILSFAYWLLVAVTLWTPILVGLAYLIGESLADWFEHYSSIALPLLLICIGVIYLVFRLAHSLTSRRGRANLRSRWYRATEWEFWPTWLVYLPVAPWIALLATHYRRPLAPTSANPAIPGAGFAMESKSLILDALTQSKPHPLVARYTLISSKDPAARSDQLASFLEEQNLNYPIVLKPDIGERGQGVAIAKSPNEALTILENCPHPIIAQEFISGPEFGVFYIRRPGQPIGEITSITAKTPIEVTGDGKSTLESLIIQHPRGIRMLRFFLRKWKNELHRVPAIDESIELGELGTHCRGSLFKNGNYLLTPELFQTIDRLSQQNTDGLRYGRYDLRAESTEALSAGIGFKIIEFNGATAEPTHIYDPSTSLLEGITTLCRHWEWLYEIGNASSTPPLSISELWAIIRNHRDHEWFEIDN